jgi:hypothetical protein
MPNQEIRRSLTDEYNPSKELTGPSNKSTRTPHRRHPRHVSPSPDKKEVELLDTGRPAQSAQETTSNTVT